MKTTRGLMGAALFGSVLTLAGCGGSGTYQIPDVAPVVKQKPDDDLLDDIEGADKPAAPAATTPAAEAPKAEPKTEPKTEPTKVEPKAAEPAKPKAETKVEPKAAEPAKPKPAKK